MTDIKYGGTDITEMYYGSTPIKSVYYGSTLIWQDLITLYEDGPPVNDPAWTTAAGVTKSYPTDANTGGVRFTETNTGGTKIIRLNLGVTSVIGKQYLLYVRTGGCTANIDQIAFRYGFSGNNAVPPASNFPQLSWWAPARFTADEAEDFYIQINMAEANGIYYTINTVLLYEVP